MRTTTQTASHRGGTLDTLAERGTSGNDSFKLKPMVMVGGNGSRMVKGKAEESKARKKMITQVMNLNIIKVIEKKADKKRLQPYWNAYHCQRKLYSSFGKLYGVYCKNRFCPICSNNRKADIINNYLPVLREWNDAYFMTLTTKAVPKKHLNERMRETKRRFRKIIDRLLKKNQRKKGIRPIGICTLECNFNPKKRTYNPHLHLIVHDKELADILMYEWLCEWGFPIVRRKGQDMKKIRDVEECMVEVIKYSSKIFVEPDPYNKSRTEIKPSIYPRALDNIFQAMKGLRIFDRFGFDLPKRDRKPKKKPLVWYEKWIFNIKLIDWVNQDTGETLTDYVPPPELVDLLRNGINDYLE